MPSNDKSNSLHAERKRRRSLSMIQRVSASRRMGQTIANSRSERGKGIAAMVRPTSSSGWTGWLARGIGTRHNRKSPSALMAHTRARASGRDALGCSSSGGADGLSTIRGRNFRGRIVRAIDGVGGQVNAGDDGEEDEYEYEDVEMDE